MTGGAVPVTLRINATIVFVDLRKRIQRDSSVVVAGIPTHAPSTYDCRKQKRKSSRIS